MIGFRVMAQPHQPEQAGLGPEYGNGTYSQPLTFTTAGAPGPFTVTNTRRRVAVPVEELEMDGTTYGAPYRIDVDVTAATAGATLVIDWCDVSPMYGPMVVEAGTHHGHESQGRYGGYSSTYRFADFTVENGTITIDNIMIRRIYEFSS